MLAEHTTGALRERAPLFPTVPWEGRDGQQWEHLVSKREAASLFLAASRTSEDLWELPHVRSWIDQWRLATAFRVYWSDVNALKGDVAVCERDWVTHSRHTESLIRSSGELFEDSRLFAYLRAAHHVLRIDHNPQAEETHTDRVFAYLAGRHLGWDEETTCFVHGKYQELVALFYPVVRSFAYNRSGGNRLMQEEWEGRAGVSVTEVAIHFYWEPMVIDPAWTVSRFLSVARQRMSDPLYFTHDTHTLEVPVETIGEQYDSLDNPEARVLNRLDSQRIRSIVADFATNETEARILLTRIFEGARYTALTAEFGVSKRDIGCLVTRFRERLGTLHAQDPDIPFSRIRGQKEMPFWDDMFSNITKYQQMFTKRQAMLKPSHQAILARLFAVQTGERDSTLAAIQESFAQEGRMITTDSIRRAVHAGINQLLYKEKPQKKHGEMHRGWSRAQEAKLVQQVARDPVLWSGLTPIQQYALTRFYIQGEGSHITQAAIAKELGVRGPTISRAINRGLRAIYRTLGNTMYNPELLTKPRHKLPK